MSAKPEGFDQMIETMKASAAVLREAGIEFMLGGGIAVWVRGGPTTDHDIDFLLRPADAQPAQDALAEAGFRPETVPEAWLLKAWDGDILIDLIFRPASGPITDEHFARADEMEVMAVRMRVASAADVLASKLLALNEQTPDYKSVLELAQSPREQIDWDDLYDATKESPFARAFFTLVEGLDIAPAPNRTQLSTVERLRAG